jgi:hypothetical protein
MKGAPFLKLPCDFPICFGVLIFAEKWEGAIRSGAKYRFFKCFFGPVVRHTASQHAGPGSNPAAKPWLFRAGVCTVFPGLS